VLFDASLKRAAKKIENYGKRQSAKVLISEGVLRISGHPRKGAETG
jgi:hypothetical protein